VWLVFAIVSLILVGGASWVVWALSQFGDHGASPEVQTTLTMSVRL
jgi:hypothetical protein